MSSGTKQTTNQTTSQNTSASNTIDPTQMAQYQNNYATAQQNGQSLTQPYTGQMVAGLTPTQVAAENQLTGVATNPNYTGAINGATSSLQGILGGLPSGNVSATPVNASTIANSNLSQYMNPFQSSVIDATMGQYGQMNANQLTATNQSATGSGAFGGSRSGVADALTNSYDAQQEAPVLAQLNASNYTNAQSAAAQDAATNNAVGEFNSNQGLTAAQDTVQNQLNSGALANTTASNINNLANSNFNLAANQGGILGNIGQQQQTQAQNQDTANLNMYQYGNTLTQAQQSMLNQALGLIPIQQTQTGASNGTMNGTTTTTQNPGAMGILGGLGSLALSAAIPGSGAILGGLGGATSLLGGLFGGNSAGQAANTADDMF